MAGSRAGPAPFDLPANREATHARTRDIRPYTKHIAKLHTKQTSPMDSFDSILRFDSIRVPDNRYIADYVYQEHTLCLHVLLLRPPIVEFRLELTLCQGSTEKFTFDSVLSHNTNAHNATPLGMSVQECSRPLLVQ